MVGAFGDMYRREERERVSVGEFDTRVRSISIWNLG